MQKKSSQRDRDEALKLPTLDQLNSVWNGVLNDVTARGALDRLKREGFDIGRLTPHDPTFKRPSWADYVAAIPLLENRPTRTRVHRPGVLGKHRPLVDKLRDFVRWLDDPFCAVSFVRTRDTDIPLDESLRDLAAKSASFLEKFISWHWRLTERNPRNALIAELRGTIRMRTGKPHDRELSTILDAACRAAGRKELLLDNTALDRIEKRAKETRVKAFRRLMSHSGVARTPKSKSTRNPKKRR